MRSSQVWLHAGEYREQRAMRDERHITVGIVCKQRLGEQTAHARCSSAATRIRMQITFTSVLQLVLTVGRATSSNSTDKSCSCCTQTVRSSTTVSCCGVEHVRVRHPGVPNPSARVFWWVFITPKCTKPRLYSTVCKRRATDMKVRLKGKESGSRRSFY